MSISQAIINGAEADEPEYERSVSSATATPSHVATPHTNATGTRGGSFCLEPLSGNGFGIVRMPILSSGLTILWEDFIIECYMTIGFNITDGAISLSAWNDGTRRSSVGFKNTGRLVHIFNSNSISEQTLPGSDDETAEDTIIRTSTDFSWLGSHIRVASSPDGFMETWVHQPDEGAPELSNTSIDTTGGTTAIDEIKVIGNNGGRVDHMFIRPRCMIITGVTGGTPDADAALTSVASPETATVYAWQSDSSDSAGGSGDATLASNEMRLFLKDLSFGPDKVSATGFADADDIIVSGVTGTLVVSAPDSHYEKGLEPGGMFIGPNLYIERTIPDATGTNTSGSLGGGASDTQDALVDMDDGKYIEHTSASERVTVNTGSLANQSDIDQIIGISVSVRGVNDGIGPTGVTPTVLDNAINLDGQSQAHTTTLNTVGHGYADNAAGTQWVKGAGAGGLNDIEIGYVSETI